MKAFTILSSQISNYIYIPKFYDPGVDLQLDELANEYSMRTVRDMVSSNELVIATGHEVGKFAYGTGSIPFVRTSDVANWEIKATPKQGVSSDIYEQYRKKQDVLAGDILFVRDGTYLIGNNCFVNDIDQIMLYQSHILKIRSNYSSVPPEILFVAINSALVQAQIRSFQFSADIIDTIGHRFLDLKLPIRKPGPEFDNIVHEVSKALSIRAKLKVFIKEWPLIIEGLLSTGDASQLAAYDHYRDNYHSHQSTITDEFGVFEAFTLGSDKIENGIMLPKYYSHDIKSELSKLTEYCDLVSIGDLIDLGVLELQSGDEIGKMAYGTGIIPFIRTSDFTNWEVIHNPKQGVSPEIYSQYREKQDIQSGDILLVRDGTYLVGTTCMITDHDEESLYCGGLIKIRVVGAQGRLDNFLLLGLLNSAIVKRQLRAKQFTRDVIDTLGRRFLEVVLPIPRCATNRSTISEAIKTIIESRIGARVKLQSIIDSYAS